MPERLTSPAEIPSRTRRISSVVRALDVFADPWTYLILREVFFRVRRFDDLQFHLQIPRNSLSERLQHLTTQGILDRVQYTDRPPRYEYRLTPSGRAFYPPIVALMSWGDRWCQSDDGPPLTLTHTTCGRKLKPVVVCGHCRQPLQPYDVVFKDGPGAGFEDLPDRRATRQRGKGETYIRGRPCSVARTLQRIGDRWSFRILRESFLGVRRFEDLLSNTGAARNILTARLKALVDNGILERRQYLMRPPRFEYVLTPAGLALYPSLLLFMVWGDQWRPTRKGPPLLLRHKGCDCVFQPLLACQACGSDVGADNVRYRMNYRVNIAKGASAT